MVNKTIQIIIAVVLIIFLVLLTDPFMLWMPPMAAVAVLICVTALLCVWAGLVMREHAHDEREMVHRMYAGRAAYLSGIAVLTIALVVQGFSHHIDPWVALALGVMVIVKLVAHLYSDNYK